MNSSYGTAPTPESKMAQVKKVRWAVLRESIQHPTTVFPLAIASVAGIYASAIHFDATSFLWTAVPALLGVGSWIYHYFIRFDKIANKHLEKLKFQALELKKSVAEELYKECRHHGFSEGAKEVRELEQAFIQLWTFLKDQQGGAPIASAERFLSLAEDSFQEGLGMLRSGLETFKLLKTLDHQKLQREVVAWMAEMKKYERDPERYAIQMSALKTKIQSHHTRLNIYRDKLNQVHQFLAQSEVIEAALETTLLEANELLNQGQFQIKADAASRLENAVAAARRVEEKLRIPSGGSPDEDLYLEAGRTHQNQDPES